LAPGDFGAFAFPAAGMAPVADECVVTTADLADGCFDVLIAGLVVPSEGKEGAAVTGAAATVFGASGVAFTGEPPGWGPQPDNAASRPTPHISAHARRWSNDRRMSLAPIVF